MTTPSTPRKAGPLIGDGSQTTWPFGFKVFAADEIKVTIADANGLETVLVLDSDYTVELNENQETSPGGTVTYPMVSDPPVDPLPSTGKLTITGNLEYDQPYDIPGGGNFNPVALENQLDRTVMQIQQLAEQVDRAVKVGATSDISPDDLLGELTQASDALEVFNDTWLGAKTSDPTTDNDGNPLVAGAAYWNTAAEIMRVYSSGAWHDTGTPVTVSTQLLSGTGSQTVFTLTNSPASEAACDIRISGLGQVPGVDFTLTGASLTTLTFTEAPPAGTNNIFVRSVSPHVIGAPSDGTVTTPKLASQAVTTAKLADGAVTVAKIGATGTPSAKKVLRGDMTWGLAGYADASVNAVGTGSLTLTSASAQYQVVRISSAANSYVTLPDATTMTSGFPPFVIENNSPIGADLAIKNSAGTVVGYLNPGSLALVLLQDNATAAGSWRVSKTVQQDAIFAMDSASFTTPTTSPSPYNAAGICGLSATSFVRYWWVTSAPLSSTRAWTLYTQVCTISGSTITAGSTQSVTLHSLSSADNTYDGQLTVERLSNTAFIVLAGAGTSFRDDTNANYQNIGNINVRVCTVSGTTVTFGTASGASMPQYNTGIYGYPYNSAHELAVNAVIKNGCVRRLSDTSFALVYNDGVTTSYAYPLNYSGSMACQIVTVSGTTMTIGTKATLATSTYSQPQSLAALSSTALFVSYSQAASAGSASGRSKMNVISVSGTTATWNTSVTVESADSNRIFEKDAANPYSNAAVAPSSTSVVFTGGYFTAAASISGTTPALLSIPQYKAATYMQLATSSRVFAAYADASRAYLDISSDGFYAYTNYVLVQASSQANTWVGNSALGAQPTTAFVSTDYTNVILGSTT